MFAFTLAKELGMTVTQLGQVMDAPEFMEWMAYFTAQNPEEVIRLNNQISSEQDILYHQNQMRNFFSQLTSKKRNGPSRRTKDADNSQ
jgi:hypothetical protein